MRAIFPGSFAPPTLGHLDIIRRASRMFDEVIVAVMSQSEKRYAFTPDMRRSMLTRITADLDNVRVVADDGLLVNLAKRMNADVIIRGLRDVGDLSFEMAMASANRQMAGIETVFVPCSPEYTLLSSTLVRDCASHRAPIETMAPAELVNDIYEICCKKGSVE